MALGADEIEALATATATATATAFQSLRAETATVNTVAVRLPLFWSGNPEVWFTQVESCFATRKVTVQKTQFDYVIQALDNSTADRVQAVILNPSETPYDTLKAALIDAFGKTQAQKDQDILNINGLGDKKPSELLQHMNNLNADPKTLFKALFLAQLPPEVRQILALSDKTDIKELAKEADRIMEVSRFSGTSQVNATGGYRKSGGRYPDSRSGGRNPGDQHPVSMSDQQWPLIPGLCKYHSKFGDRARSCLSPCKFQGVPGTGKHPTFSGPGNGTPGRH
jgi:hypothetical protein